MKLNKDSGILSIIIPVLNEEAYISPLLDHLKKHCSELTREIIVVDGGSSDQTVSLARKENIRVVVADRGRASQMNAGASKATGDVLYFLHVDTYPPADFEKAIINAVNSDNPAGCFQMKFDSKSTFLSFFAWFTRLNYQLCRGGDQSLFITADLFCESGGFDEKYKIYEDSEFISRLYKLNRFKVLPETVTTSARKYKKNGTWRLQYHFSMIHIKRFFGAGPEELHEYYRRHIAT